MPYQLLHILNLDTIGGVEHLFVNYINRYPALVSIPGKAPHPQFASRLKNVFRERPFMLPKFIGAYRRKKLIDSLENPHIVFWNRIEKTRPHKGRVTYYEHGASWMNETALPDIDNAIAVSIAAREMLRQRMSYTKPITVIPNPRRPDIPIIEAPRKAPSRLRLGYIGRLIPLKGVPIALHILKTLGPDAELHITGDGSDFELIQALTRHLHLQSQVLLTRNTTDIPSWYDNIDILIIPSIREPLGLIAVEAAARGVPVLAANVDGLPEVASGICLEPTLPIQEYQNLGGRLENLPELVYNPTTKLLTPPRIIDPEIAAESILTILNDYESYSRRALEKAHAHPTFEAYAAALTSALQV